MTVFGGWVGGIRFRRPSLLPNAALSSSTMKLNQPAQIACRYKIFYCASRHKHAYVKNV